MATIEAVAGRILSRYGSLTTMKLQKLVYYAQAHALVTLGEPLFESEFQAWRAGPVSVDLYRHHKGQFLILPETLPEIPGVLTEAETALIDEVCDALGNLTGNELSELTHSQEPWKAVRGGLHPSESSSNVISKESIRSYHQVHPVFS